jgi:hypothetical protein
VDVSYSYKPLHHPGLPHAFINALLYLDYDRTGFDYPLIPFSVNCYGSRVIGHKGFLSRFDDSARPDPPSPTPASLLRLGAATVRALADTDLRVALVASSSWSHAFLCDKTWRLQPDREGDETMYASMCDGTYAEWFAATVESLEQAGQQELLNWFPLIGAMNAGGASLQWSTLVRTYAFNSNKAFAVFSS